MNSSTFTLKKNNIGIQKLVRNYVKINKHEANDKGYFS